MPVVHTPRRHPGRDRFRHAAFSLVELLAVLAVIGILIALLLPNVRSARPAARRMQCSNNLKQIALALHNYHDTYGALPPAYTVDPEGRPLHSWRTLLLPFLEQQALYARIDLSKPWDDPVNADIAKMNIPIFRCPNATGPAGHTSYLAVVTNDSAIRAGQSLTFSGITDGISQTLLVIEVDSKHGVPWIAPVDAGENLVLGFNPDGPLPHEGGINAAMADGSVRFLGAKMERATRSALITATADDNHVLTE